MDETTLSLNYPICNCWMKRGQQKTIPAFSGKREYLHVIGAYNWRTDNVTCLQVERKNTEGFVAFLEELLVKTYAHHPVILVMDNASYHYSRAVRAMLSLFAHRIRVLWLPQYCPELNAIERFWRHLKQTALSQQSNIVKAGEACLAPTQRPDRGTIYHRQFTRLSNSGLASATQ